MTSGQQHFLSAPPGHRWRSTPRKGRTVSALVLLVSLPLVTPIVDCSSDHRTTDCEMWVGSWMEACRTPKFPVTTSSSLALRLQPDKSLANFTLHLSFSESWRSPEGTFMSGARHRFSKETMEIRNDSNKFVDESSRDIVSHSNDSFRLLFVSSNYNNTYFYMSGTDGISQSIRRFPIVLQLNRFSMTTLILTLEPAGLRVSCSHKGVFWSLVVDPPKPHTTLLYWWIEVTPRSYLVLDTCPATGLACSTCCSGESSNCTLDNSLCSHHYWAWLILGAIAVLIFIALCVLYNSSKCVNI